MWSRITTIRIGPPCQGFWLRSAVATSVRAELFSYISGPLPRLHRSLFITLLCSILSYCSTSSLSTHRVAIVLAPPISTILAIASPHEWIRSTVRKAPGRNIAVQLFVVWGQVPLVDNHQLTSILAQVPEHQLSDILVRTLLRLKFWSPG